MSRRWLQEPAVLAEEFALTHKAIFNKAEPSVGGQAVKTPPFRGSLGVKTDRQCFYCHIVSDCLALKCKQQQPKGAGLVGSKGVVGDPELCFKPFIFDRVVSLTGLPGDQKPVRILRDTDGSPPAVSRCRARGPLGPLGCIGARTNC